MRIYNQFLALALLAVGTAIFAKLRPIGPPRHSHRCARPIRRDRRHSRSHSRHLRQRPLRLRSRSNRK